MAAAICLMPVSEPSAAAKKAAAKTPPLPGLAAGQSLHVETVSFAGPRRTAVKVVRGGAGAAAPPPPAPRVEVVSFGRGGAQRVMVVRGNAPAVHVSTQTTELQPKGLVETVAFADPGKSSVIVVRGPSLGNIATDLFGPAKGGEIDRIAFAVDGIESRHGADPRMWRPGLDGPQGPMQVSLAAAIDVGGGNRFDLSENRRLGRAYLTQLYRRYGNWADALAAYNWGLGNLDQWIAGGRQIDRLPLETLRYVERALREALLPETARF